MSHDVRQAPVTFEQFGTVKHTLQVAFPKVGIILARPVKTAQHVELDAIFRQVKVTRHQVQFLFD